MKNFEIELEEEIIRLINHWKDALTDLSFTSLASLEYQGKIAGAEQILELINYIQQKSK